MFALVKRTTRFIANLSGELVGRGGSDPEMRTRLANYAHKMGPFTKILLLRLLVEHATVTGQSVDGYSEQLRKAEQAI